MNGFVDKKANSFGNIIHSLFEKHINEKNELDKDSIFKEGIRRLNDYNLNGYNRRLYNIINKYDENKFLSHQLAGVFKVIEKELYLKKSLKDKVIITGEIDKLLINKDTVIIVDYKTTLKVNNLNCYRVQAMGYSDLLQANGLLIGIKKLYFMVNYLDFGLNKIIKIDRRRKIKLQYLNM